MSGEVCKSHGLSVLCDSLGISSDEVVAFGDNYNDLDMVEWAGTGVAVNNAVQDLKDVADIVATLDRSRGVHEVLRRLFADRLDHRC